MEDSSNKNLETQTIKHVENNTYIINHDGFELKTKKLSKSVYVYDGQMKTGSGYVAMVNRYLKQDMNNHFNEISFEEAMKLIKLENTSEKSL